MKRLMTFVFALATLSCWAQNFEGTIKWSMKFEVTDPEMKAKMEAGQKQMSDPATQAKMKELQEKMKDPKFKAMMEQNPQMKAMMEKMTQGNGGDMMSNMMPKGMTIKLKGDNSLVTMEGGMAAGDFLHTKDKSVMLNREQKTYSVMPSYEGQGAPQSQAQPTVTKTGETMKILGYTCTKYIVTMSEHGQTMTSNMWTTTDIKGVDMKSMAKQRMGRGQMFYSNVDGVPLRIESNTPQGQMVMEVTDFKRESLDASDFTIPADYKETQGAFGRN